MALMIVKETSQEGSREYELNQENVRRIEQLTGMSVQTIYTKLSAGQAIHGEGTQWEMLRQ